MLCYVMLTDVNLCCVSCKPSTSLFTILYSQILMLVMTVLVFRVFRLVQY